MKNKKLTASFNLSKIARNLMLVTSLLSPAFFISCAKQRLDDIEKIDCVAPAKEIKDFSVYRAAALSTNNQQVSIRFQIDYCTIKANQSKSVTVTATNDLDGSMTSPVFLTLAPNQKTISNVIADLSLSDSGKTIPFTLTMTDETGRIVQTFTSVDVPKFPSNISAFVTSNPANSATAVTVFRNSLDFVLSNGTLTQQEDPSGNLITVDTLVNNNAGSIQLMVGSTSYNYTFPNSNVIVTNGSTQTASLAVDSTKFNNGSSTAPVQLQYGAGVSWTYYWNDNAGGTFFQSGTFTVEDNPIVQAGNASGIGLENEYNTFKLFAQSGVVYLELHNFFNNYGIKTIPLTVSGTIPSPSVNAVTHFDSTNNIINIWGSAATDPTPTTPSNKFGDAHQSGHYQTIIDINAGTITTTNYPAAGGYETIAGIWDGFSSAPGGTKVMFLEQSASFTTTATPVQSVARFLYGAEDQTIVLTSTNGLGPIDSFFKNDTYYVIDQIGNISAYNFNYSSGSPLNSKMSISSNTALSLPSNYLAATKIIDIPSDPQGVGFLYYDSTGLQHLAQYSGTTLTGYVPLGVNNAWQINVPNSVGPDILFQAIDLNGQSTTYENSNFTGNTLGPNLYQYTGLTGLFNVNAFFRPKNKESAAQIPASVGEGLLWVDVPNQVIRKHTMDGKEVTTSPYPISITSDIAGMISVANVIQTKVIYRPAGDILIGQYQNGSFKEIRVSVPGSAITPLVVASGLGDIKKIYGADVYVNGGTGNPTILAAFEDPAKTDVITVKDALGNSFDTPTVSGRFLTGPFKLIAPNLSNGKMLGLLATNKGLDLYEIDRTTFIATRKFPAGDLANSPAVLAALGADAATDVKIIDYQVTPECANADTNAHSLPILAEITVGLQKSQVIFNLDLNDLSGTANTVTSTLVPSWIAKNSFQSQLTNFKLENDGVLSIINQNGKIYMVPATLGVPDTTKGTWGVEFYNSTGVIFDATTGNL